ncbi:MAG: tetratricopeptide repeat protein [Acidobacteriota bacterium]|nr:tetratricopeptide repeat protein [Acidobacteriota bacterium]
MLEVTGKNWVAQNNLGHALQNQDREDEALPHLQEAVAINPSDADSNLNIGAYDQQHKNMSAALEQYEKVVSLTQNNARLTLPIRDQAFRNMGYVYLSQGDHVRARESFQQAVNLNPQDGEAWIGLGVMEQGLGESNRAVDAYNHALRIQPFDLGYLLLSRAPQQAGRVEEAPIAMKKAQ